MYLQHRCGHCKANVHACVLWVCASRCVLACQASRALPWLQLTLSQLCGAAQTLVCIAASALGVDEQQSWRDIACQLELHDKCESSLAPTEHLTPERYHETLTACVQVRFVQQSDYFRCLGQLDGNMSYAGHCLLLLVVL